MGFLSQPPPHHPIIGELRDFVRLCMETTVLSTLQPLQMAVNDLSYTEHTRPTLYITDSNILEGGASGLILVVVREFGEDI